MIRRPPRSTQSRSLAASDVYKRQPISDGAFRLPEALGPWQVAQFARNSWEPAAMSSAVGAAAAAGPSVRAAYPAPTASSAPSSSATGANRWYRRAAGAFTSGPSLGGAGLDREASADQVDHAEQRDPH